jgi:ubiquinol-cytochrome c reductase cytochrome c1 subunit
MKKILFALIAALGIAGSAFANEGGEVAWDHAPNTQNDLTSLQNGAKLFVNYCLNCHSAAYMRYNRLRDIGLTEQQIKDNLLFTSAKVGDTMKSAIDPKQAKDWFGAVPPDLTLIARSRAGHGGTGTDYLYTYMRTFYRDPARPTGWNNLVFPNVGMPHVLWQLQGEREPEFDEREVHGQKEKVFTGWKQVTPGTLSTADYDHAVGDLVNYLQWMSEPAQNSRVRVGVWVMIFLVVLTFFAWRLNAAFWKDVR